MFFTGLFLVIVFAGNYLFASDGTDAPPVQASCSYDAQVLVVASDDQLFARVSEGNAERVAELLRSDSTINVNKEQSAGITPLFVAVVHGYTLIAETLLQRGATISPEMVHAAAERGHEAVLEVLMRYNSDLTVYRKSDHATVLTLALVHGHEKIADTLLEKAPTLVHSGDKNGATPIHLAAKCCSAVIAQKMLTTMSKLQHDQYVQRVNQADSCGNTPLHAAAGRGSFEMVKLLLQNGAQTETKNNEHATALYLARRGKHEAVTRLLESWGGAVRAPSLVESGAAAATAVAQRVAAAGSSAFSVVMGAVKSLSG